MILRWSGDCAWPNDIERGFTPDQHLGTLCDANGQNVFAVGTELATRLRDLTLALYGRGAEYAASTDLATVNDPGGCVVRDDVAMEARFGAPDSIIQRAAGWMFQRRHQHLRRQFG